MSLTRDQLRAARVLLHLHQTQLADIARIGVATIRRFEGGKDISHLHLDALRRAVIEAGAVLVDEDRKLDAQPRAVGVLLGPEDQLPEATRLRIAADRARATSSPGTVQEGGTPGAASLVQAEEGSSVLKGTAAKPKPGGRGGERPAKIATSQMAGTSTDGGK